MRRLQILLFLALVVSCKPSGEKKTGAPTTKKEQVPALSSFEGAAGLLLKQLRDQGDYVNSRQYPSMIKPASVFEELDSNNLIIDIREKALFQAGHIKAALNVPMEKLLSFFENDIIPFRYDKIILVSQGGQRSAYATNLMRLMGYGNVYTMRWGMCGWNSAFAAELVDRIISSEFQDRLSTVSSPKPGTARQPVLTSTATTGEEILRERVSRLLSQGTKDVFIRSDEIFADPDNYFIINFERRDKYESGHIPGAVRYKQQGTLGIPAMMGTLPVDRTIVLYCGTGMSSSFAVAYLRLFGYDARSLKYGNHSFMYRKMLEEKDRLSWNTFSESTPGEFPYVTGE